MKVQIEIDVETDGPLTKGDSVKLREHLETMFRDPCLALSRQFGTEPRALGTVCRFRFLHVELKVLK